MSFVDDFVEIGSALDVEERALLEIGRRGRCWAELAIDREDCVERLGLSDGTDQDFCTSPVPSLRSPCRGAEVDKAFQMLGRESAEIHEFAALLEMPETALAFGPAASGIDSAGKEQLDGVAVRRPGDIGRGRAESPQDERVADVDVELRHVFFCARRAAHRKHEKHRQACQPNSIFHVCALPLSDWIRASRGCLRARSGATKQD